ncbi:hypothetical protein GOP47_0025208 [Adiantum capillus-veneris]|uniref:Pentatricopeptide repeat-containing protein n=1 Tax=Adiantum capillus-veneris TaxID=13818 RepID=A0A9D4Z395_ADICA|nr:hypothetical protein GOP47_0025208 [Adiantum capillus-veneris]
MATTIQQNVGVATSSQERAHHYDSRKPRGDSQCKAGPAVDTWHNPSLHYEEGLALATQSQDTENNKKSALDDGCSALIAMLRACGKCKDLQQGIRLHDEILKRHFLRRCSDALATMYAKCGALSKAKELLYKHHSKDLYSWTDLIAGYARQGLYHDALECFRQMQYEGLSPDAVTFACILKACGNLKASNMGKRIHDEIARQGLLGTDMVLASALVDMYAKCGALASAQQVLEELPFRNVVSWSALIAGYAQEGQGEQALHCFEQMQCEGFSPDEVTFACVLKACGTIEDVDKGKQIHEEIAKQGFLDTNIVLGSALVDMYAKCGALAKAQQVLEEMPSRNVVSWSALIAGYAQQGLGKEALNCFDQMKREGLSPNAVTYSSVLKACGSIQDIDRGEQIYDQIARQGLLGNNIVLGTAVVDMYVKCGALAKAQKVLEELPSRDAVSWSALITGFCHQGQGEQALTCFKQMLSEGLSPDAVTFSCILNTCSHLGLLEDAHMYFMAMNTKYGVKPSIEHYTCMVDLFGRAGHLDKAARVIQEMPFYDHVAVLSTLMGACRKWGDVNVGRWAFEQAVNVDKRDGSTYVIMADIYAAAGMQEDADMINFMKVENCGI